MTACGSGSGAAAGAWTGCAGVSGAGCAASGWGSTLPGVAGCTWACSGAISGLAGSGLVGVGKDDCGMSMVLSGTLTVEPESVAMALGMGRASAPVTFGSSGRGAASAGCRGFTACAGCSAGSGACTGEAAGTGAGVAGGRGVAGVAGGCGVAGAGGGGAGAGARDTSGGGKAGAGAGRGGEAAGLGGVTAVGLRFVTCARLCSDVREADGRASGRSAGARVTTSIGAERNS